MAKQERVIVYCEHGGLRRELRKLRADGRIELVIFPYEQRYRGTTRIAVPSHALVDDLCQVMVDELEFPIDTFSPSDKFPAIQAIVGVENRVDVLHIDSAYKTGCAVFFTRDHGDILAKRDELEGLLGIRFFHPDRDWQAFLSLLAAA